MKIQISRSARHRPGSNGESAAAASSHSGSVTQTSARQEHDERCQHHPSYDPHQRTVFRYATLAS